MGWENMVFSSFHLLINISKTVRMQKKQAPFYIHSTFILHCLGEIFKSQKH